MARIGIIRSGGQSGADRGALEAARNAGIALHGWCPAGGWAEDMPNPPGVRTSYPELIETPLAKPIQRTEWNVRDSDATLIVCPGEIARSSGTYATLEFAESYRRPFLVSDGNDFPRVAAWLDELAFDRQIDLNVAGPRESGSPGICELTRNLVSQLLI